MSFSTFHSVGRRLAPLVLRQQQLQKQQRRTMAGLAERPLKTDWTGADKFVRYYFPHDWQLARAILFGYAGLIVLAKVYFSMKAKPPVEIATPSTRVASISSSRGNFPSPEDPGFEAYLDSKDFQDYVDSKEFEEYVESREFQELVEDEKAIETMFG